MATWQTFANRIVNTPEVLMELTYDGSSKKYFSLDYIRTTTKTYQGKIESLPQIRSIIGDVTRTYEKGNIVLIISDTDYELRTLITTMSKSFLNSLVELKIGFQEDEWNNLLTIYTGYITNWKFLDGLKVQFEVTEKAKNTENEQPDYLVSLSDYPNADQSAVSQIIPIPWGIISAYGLSNDGAYGWPSLANSTGLAFVDTTQDSEKHLVGRQLGAITVNRVYLNGTLKTLNTHYTISTQTISGKTHTEIHWQSGVRPTANDFVSCDIDMQIGSYLPTINIYTFLVYFNGYTYPGDFDTDLLSAAQTIETNRGYTLNGVLWEKKSLNSILDDWRDEFELDIYWNKVGKICFRYLTKSTGDSNTKHYKDYLDIIGNGFEVENKIKDLVNHLRYGYNYHYSKTYYHNLSTKQDSASQTKYGEVRDAFKGYKWARSSSMASDLATRRVNRLKNPPKLLKCIFPLKTYSHDLADPVYITHFGGEGSSGYSQKLWQIRSMDLNLNNLTNTMTLEDTSNFSS